eukprot:scaffold97630_cov69-Phaeocystis_antarctica.AAC.8
MRSPHVPDHSKAVEGMGMLPCSRHRFDGALHVCSSTLRPPAAPHAHDSVTAHVEPDGVSRHTQGRGCTAACFCALGVG